MNRSSFQPSRRWRCVSVSVCGAVASLLACGCLSPITTAPPRDRLPPWALDTQRFAVAADHADASAAGAEILALGGNAVDAAVATSLALAVVRPESCGLGGGGFMVIHRPGAAPVALDFREMAPAAATLDNYLDVDGQPIPGKSMRGAWSVAVPGQIKGLLVALEQHGSGRVTREQVFAPAIRLARAPLVVDAHLHDALNELSRMWRESQGLQHESLAELARVYLNDGAPRAVGETVDISPLAGTLELLAAEGLAAYDTGVIGQQIVAEVQRLGGRMTLDDLRAYSVRQQEPLRTQYLGREILTMPPPSSGGAVIIEVLNLLAACGDGGDSGGTLDAGLRAHLLVEALKFGFADRAALLGDRSPEVAAGLALMQNDERIAQRAALMDGSRTFGPSHYGGEVNTVSDGGTSHYCVVDGDGMAVAGTDTVNLYFGSGILVPGAGFVLNDQMDDFAVTTDAPNAFGLRQSKHNLIQPGRRPLSSMSPTIVLRDGQVQLVVGASGGPRIITCTLQVLLHVIRDGMLLDQAMTAPRLHHQWLPDEVLFSENAGDTLIRALLQRGHRVVLTHGSLAHVQAIARTSGGYRAASDPEKGGRPAGE